MNPVRALQFPSTYPAKWTGPFEPPEPLEEPFIWTINDGVDTTPALMDTGHLFHSLRMIWNHTCPEGLRLYPFREWKGVASWPSFYLRDAFEAFTKELALGTRAAQLSDAQKTELFHMRLYESEWDRALGHDFATQDDHLSPFDVDHEH